MKNVLKETSTSISKIKYIILEQPKPSDEIQRNDKMYNIKDSYYIGAPNYESYVNFMNENNFQEVVKFEENLFEDNVLYKNILLN